MMSNKKQLKMLREKFLSEEIGLPESLSAENMEKLINEKRDMTMVSSVEIPKKNSRVLKRIASVAAVIVIVCAVFVAAGLTANDIVLQKQENIIAGKTENSDNSKIETIVLSYYKNIYNETKRSSFDFYFGAAKEDMAIGSVNSGIDSTPTSASNSSAFMDTEAGSTDSKYSSTNVQVSGVDEGDIIKNDGRYIYYLNPKEIVIADAENPEKMNVVSRVDLSDDDSDSDMYGWYLPGEIYIYENKMVVITGIEAAYEQAEPRNGETVDYADCCRLYINTDTLVRIYDITDKSNPTLAYSYQTDGSYVSSRLIGGKLLTVSAYSIPYYQIATDTNYTSFEESCDEIKKVGIPMYSLNGNAKKQVHADCIKIVDDDEPTSYVITSVFDLDNNQKEPKMNASLCGAYEIYCTQDNLFLAETEYSYWTNGRDYKVEDDNGNQFDSVTHIYKYDITNEGVIYKSTATVGGTSLDQFSMDAYNGMFRIATNGSDDKGARQSYVYVLDGDLKIKGYLGGIAKDESMQSSRFMGDMLYLVTFYQTDPLFVIDLSDPTNPKIQGELKIPGFSSYLHPVGNGLVVGIGEGGTETGTDGSAKVSLFDVRDPGNPREISKFTVPSAYFETSHKAFTVIDEDSFALCIRICSYDRVHNYSESQKVMMFDIVDGELVLHGEYDCKSPGQYYRIDNIRSAFIDNTLFTVSDCGIIAYNMPDNKKLGEVDF